MKIYNEKTGRVIDCDVVQAKLMLDRKDSPYTKEKPKSVIKAEKLAAKNSTNPTGTGMSANQVAAMIESALADLVSSMVEDLKTVISEQITGAIAEIPDVPEGTSMDQVAGFVQDAMKDSMDSNATEKLIRKLVAKTSLKK